MLVSDYLAAIAGNAFILCDCLIAIGMILRQARRYTYALCSDYDRACLCAESIPSIVIIIHDGSFPSLAHYISLKDFTLVAVKEIGILTHLFRIDFNYADLGFAINRPYRSLILRCLD